MRIVFFLRGGGRGRGLGFWGFLYACCGDLYIPVVTYKVVRPSARFGFCLLKNLV
jgi:hypothetical protein